MSELHFKAICETSSTAKKNLFPIRPDDLVLLHGSSDASTFGTAEVEEIAGHLIEFFKIRGYWSSFTIDELRRFYELKGWNSNLMFYGLLGAYDHDSNFGDSLYMPAQVYLAMDTLGNWMVTDTFIKQCITQSKRQAA